MAGIRVDPRRVHDRDPDEDKQAYKKAKQSVKETVLKFQRNALPAIVCIKGHPLHAPYRRENKPLLTILMEHFHIGSVFTDLTPENKNRLENFITRIERDHCQRIARMRDRHPSQK